MPTVPVYDTPSVDAQAGAMPALQAPNVAPMDNFAAKQQIELGKAALATGTTFYKIADRLQGEYDDARKQEMYNAFAERADEIENKFANLSGKQAFDEQGNARGAIKKQFEEIQGTAENDMQKALFTQAAQVRMRQSSSVIGRHASVQLKVYEQENGKAFIKTLVRDAAKNFNSWDMKDADGKPDGEFVLNRDAAIKATQDYVVNILGEPKDSPRYKEAVMETNTAVVEQAVHLMVAKDQGTAARKFLEQANKEGRVNSDKLDELTNLVNTAGLKEESLNLSFKVSGNPAAAKSQLDNMFKKGDITAEVRDATLQRVSSTWQMNKAVEAEGNKAAMGNAQMWVLKNPGKSILDMPSNLLNWAQREGHLGALDSFAQREGRPAERQQELRVRGELLNMAMTDPDKFIDEFKTNAFMTRMDLGTAGIKEMQTIAADMMNNNGRFKTVFDQKILQDNIPKDLLKSSRKDERDAFIAIMAEKQTEWIKANPGKKPTSAVYSELARSANEEWVSIGLWNSTEKAYKVRASGDLNAVPKTFYNGMKAAGASDDEIIQAWTLKNGKK